MKKKICKYCYGKGYYSYLEILCGHPDFFRDKTYMSKPKIIFKRCKKCKSKKKLPKTLFLNLI